eukprot:scaffold85420_cov18-Tisochrysis_lutea.AAC.2
MTVGAQVGSLCSQWETIQHLKGKQLTLIFEFDSLCPPSVSHPTPFTSPLSQPSHVGGLLRHGQKRVLFMGMTVSQRQFFRPDLPMGCQNARHTPALASK